MYYKNNSYDLNSVKKFRVNKYMNPKILNYKGMNNTNKNKDFKRIIYDKFKKRNCSSTQKRIKSSLPSQITKRLNKTQDHLHKEYLKEDNIIFKTKYKTKEVIQKLNDINKRLKAKKTVIEKKTRKKDYIVTKIINLFKKKEIGVEKAMKKDSRDYIKEMGHYIKVKNNLIHESNVSILFNDSGLTSDIFIIPF